MKMCCPVCPGNGDIHLVLGQYRCTLCLCWWSEAEVERVRRANPVSPVEEGR